MTTMQPVKVVSDDDGHWYVIPNMMLPFFLADLQNDKLVESGEFSARYGRYATGGDINLVQLHAEI